MTKPHANLISSQNPYYYVMAKCVRHAYLCGVDKQTNQNFDHRKQWMIERIRFLTNVFTINVANYAVMSKRYQLIVHINFDKAQALSLLEVCDRYEKIYKIPTIVKRLLNHESNDNKEHQEALFLVEEYRHRLSSISWFMRNVHEYIARKSNKEDGCTGRFWENSTKTKPLLDEKALLSYMSEVALTYEEAVA